MKKAIIPLLLVVLAGAYFYLTRTGDQQAGYQRPPTVVHTESARVDTIVDDVEALGTVHAREAVTITANVTAKVDEVHFEDSDRVTAGQLLVALDASQQRARLREAEVILADDRRLLNHYLKLAKTDAVSQTLLDEQRAKVAASEARVEAARAQLEDYTIVAPFSGHLGARQVSPGSLVKPGTAITTLDALDTVQVEFTVPERWLGQMAEGRMVAATSVAYPGYLFEGAISSVGSRVDPETRAVPVRVRMTNADRRLRPGMLLNIRVRGTPQEVLLVSERAVVQEGAETIVYVIGDDHVAERRQVRTGRLVDGQVVIEEGLEAGERVVVEGALKLAPGMPVRLPSADGQEKFPNAGDQKTG